MRRDRTKASSLPGSLAGNRPTSVTLVEIGYTEDRFRRSQKMSADKSRQTNIGVVVEWVRRQCENYLRKRQLADTIDGNAIEPIPSEEVEQRKQRSKRERTIRLIKALEAKGIRPRNCRYTHQQITAALARSRALDDKLKAADGDDVNPNAPGAKERQMVRMLKTAKCLAEDLPLHFLTTTWNRPSITTRTS